MPCPRLHRGQGFAALLSVRFICLTVRDWFSFGPVGGGRRVLSRSQPTLGRTEQTLWHISTKSAPADDTVLKRTSGFPDREAATEAARADAKRLKAVPKPPQVGRILVGQNADQSTRP